MSRLRVPSNPEPNYAVVDAWEPPHQLALDADLCDAILATADEPDQADNWTNGNNYSDTLTPDLEAEVVARFETANRVWWGLDLTGWTCRLKRYEVGDSHLAHQDLHPGAARRKFAGVVQLSDPADYAGGALEVIAPLGGMSRHAMPRTRGTLIAFPGWTMHEVRPVTAGTRWSLCVNGFGPRLR
jgi:predicted 2-oxoglutarate/Fe(II)-dependent dioxygenase YbiX